MGPRAKAFLAKRLIVLSALAAAMAAAARLAGRDWPFELLTHFVWHYLIGGVVLAGLLLWLGRRRWALLAAATALIQLPVLLALPGVPAQVCGSPKDAETLRIAQFNINRSNGDASSFYSWLIARPIRPDLVLLFEASERLEESLHSMEQDLWPQVVRRLSEDPSGIAAASRVPGATLVLEEIGDSGFPSVVVRRGDASSGIPFLLIASHPPPPLNAPLAAARDRQLAALAERIGKDLVASRILLGDLNLTAWSPRYARLVERGRLRQAREGVLPQGTFPTYGLPSVLALPIDLTLVSPAIRLLGREVGPGFGSDHRVVETRLLLSRCPGEVR